MKTEQDNVAVAAVAAFAGGSEFRTGGKSRRKWSLLLKTKDLYDRCQELGFEVRSAQRAECEELLEAHAEKVEDDLNTKELWQLRGICLDYDLGILGTRTDLKERLMLQLVCGISSGTVESLLQDLYGLDVTVKKRGRPRQNPFQKREGDPLLSLPLSELKSILTERGIPIYGRKKDMVERFRSGKRKRRGRKPTTKDLMDSIAVRTGDGQYESKKQPRREYQLPTSHQKTIDSSDEEDTCGHSQMNPSQTNKRQKRRNPKTYAETTRDNHDEDDEDQDEDENENEAEDGSDISEEELKHGVARPKIRRTMQPRKSKPRNSLADSASHESDSGKEEKFEGSDSDYASDDNDSGEDRQSKHQKAYSTSKHRNEHSRQPLNHGKLEIEGESDMSDDSCFDNAKPRHSHKRAKKSDNSSAPRKYENQENFRLVNNNVQPMTVIPSRLVVDARDFIKSERRNEEGINDSRENKVEHVREQNHHAITGVPKSSANTSAVLELTENQAFAAFTRLYRRRKCTNIPVVSIDELREQFSRRIKVAPVQNEESMLAAVNALFRRKCDPILTRPPDASWTKTELRDYCTEKGICNQNDKTELLERALQIAKSRARGLYTNLQSYQKRADAWIDYAPLVHGYPPADLRSRHEVEPVKLDRYIVSMESILVDGIPIMSAPDLQEMHRRQLGWASTNKHEAQSSAWYQAHIHFFGLEHFLSHERSPEDATKPELARALEQAVLLGLCLEPCAQVQRSLLPLKQALVQRYKARIEKFGAQISHQEHPAHGYSRNEALYEWRNDQLQSLGTLAYVDEQETSNTDLSASKNPFMSLSQQRPATAEDLIAKADAKAEEEALARDLGELKSEIEIEPALLLNPPRRDSMDPEDQDLTQRLFELHSHLQVQC